MKRKLRLRRSLRGLGFDDPKGTLVEELANTKMPSNFDKILATCRSRGIYCVPMLQSLAQIKILFADGAWEGVIGYCDTFLYLGGNEPSTFEYISKLLGKWTIDKKTSDESRGATGSTSENYEEMDLFDVSISDFISPARKRMIKNILRNDPKPDEKVILRIIDPRDSEAEMMRKWKV